MKPTRRIILLLLFMLLTSPTVIAQSDDGQGLPTEDTYENVKKGNKKFEVTYGNEHLKIVKKAIIHVDDYRIKYKY